MMYLAIDFETTGIDPVHNQPLSFCGIVDFIGNKVAVEHLPRFQCQFVWDSINIHYKAAKINEGLMQRFMNRDFNNPIMPRDFKNNLLKFIQEQGFRTPVTIAGKNPSFDRGFAMALGVDYFSFRMIDPAILYMRPEDEVVPSLTTCLNRIMEPVSNLHDETFDAESVIRLIRNYYK